MKHQKLFGAAVCVAALVAACQPSAVDYPSYETSNTNVVDVARVELTDSTTDVYVDVYYHPGHWVRFDKNSYLRAGGEKYMLVSAEGMTPDSLFWMPESGEASFVMHFEPVPSGTKMLDFVESDCADCFKICGIDLTGQKASAPAFDLPAEAKVADANQPMPDPVMECGNTTINIEVADAKSKSSMMLLMVPMLGEQAEMISLDVDTLTGKCQTDIFQAGPAMSIVVCQNTLLGTLWTAPGETLNVYADNRHQALGELNYRKRSEANNPSGKPQTLYTTGHYANFNNCINKYNTQHLWQFEPFMPEYTLSAKAYADSLIAYYNKTNAYIDQVAKEPLVKEILQTTLKQDVAQMSFQGDYERMRDYIRKTHQNLFTEEDIKAILDPMTADEVQRVLALFDITDYKLLMGGRFQRFVMAAHDENMTQLIGDQRGPLTEIFYGYKTYQQAGNGDLDEEWIKQLEEKGYGFAAKACKAQYDYTMEMMAQNKKESLVMENPEVSDDKLFATMVEAYKGKVVVVDFWNTWCGPCRQNIAEKESLKKKIDDPNLVWLYLADDSSPLPTYSKMVKDIYGVHYRLPRQKMQYLYKQFEIDGIPGFVLVDKQGKAAKRDDMYHAQAMAEIVGSELAK